MFHVLFQQQDRHADLIDPTEWRIAPSLTGHGTPKPVWTFLEPRKVVGYGSDPGYCVCGGIIERR